MQGVSTYCTVCQAKKKMLVRLNENRRTYQLKQMLHLISEWIVSGRDLVVESEATDNMTMDQEMFVRFDENFEGPYSNACFPETNFRER